jgi:DNA-binding CsgD family transcriptional regulator
VRTGVVGRHAELAELEAFLDDAQSSFAVLALEGAPGIGKSVLWREGRRRAEPRFTVLWCRPAEAEAKLSLAAIADLLAPLAEHDYEALPAPQREALEVALLRRTPGQRAPDPRAIAAGFLTLIRQLASERPVVLAIDDAQWLDTPSRRILEFAARRLETEPLGLLYCLRGPTPEASFGPVVAADRFRRMRLGPLSLAALGGILADHLEQRLPRPALVRISQASAGNPFYALEIGRLLIDSGVPHGATAALPVPDDLRALTAQRIARLPERSREALLLAAVLPNPMLTMFEAGDLEAAEEAGIIAVDPSGAVEFGHPLFASAVMSGIGAPRRRELHRQASALTIDPEQRARHLALADERPQSELAEQLEAAARLAASRGATDAAAELFELAAARTPAGAVETSSDRLLAALHFHLEAGDLGRAERLADTVIAQAPTDRLRAQGKQAAAQLAARRSNFIRATSLASEALELAGADAHLCAGIELDLVFCAISLADLASADAHARAAVGHAEAAGEDGMLAEALAVMSVTQFLAGAGLNRERMQLALGLEDPLTPRSFIMRPRLIQGMLALWSGEFPEARQALSDVRDESVARGQEGVVPMISLYLVWEAVWRGDLLEATGLAERSTDAAVLLDDPTITGLALTASAIVHAHTGESTRARAEASEALKLFEELQWHSGVIWPRWALGLAALSEGDPAGVDAVLAPVAEQLLGLGLGDPVMAMFLPDEIEALITLGELERAERYLTSFEQRARDLDRPWARAAAERVRGALAAVAGDDDSAAAAFERAFAQHERTPMPFERARTLLLAGQAHRRYKRRGQARSMLEEALNVFTSMGAPRWAQRTRAELERLGRPSAGRDELTPTERRLAEMAATGLSNREVSERCFVSVKTVEANLSRVYRKLGLRSRVELANHFRAADAGGADARGSAEAARSASKT